jgi:hypothetical protein
MNFRQYLELNILRWIHFGNCYGNGMIMGGLRYLCMWIVTHNNFMTNANIADHPCCHHCNMNMETVLHALRDCHVAQNVWNSLVNCGDKKEFYYATLSSWMIQQLLLTQDDALQFELNYGRVITGPELAWSLKIRELIT